MRKLILAAVLLSLIGPSNAGNGLIVISAVHSAIEKGAVIEPTQAINLKSGESLKLLSSSGGIIQLQGPYDGTIKFQPKTGDSSIIDSVSELVKKSKSTDFTLAVFRNLSVVAPSYRPDIWGVDIRKSGKYCLRQNQPVHLWWPQATQGALIILTDTTRSRSIEVEWTDRKNYTAWPQKLPVNRSVIYSAKDSQGRILSEFKLQMMPDDLAGEMAQIAWMSDQGCSKQAVRLLGTIVNESQ